MRGLITVVALFACAVMAQAQQLNNRFFIYDDCTSLSSAACDVTVQQPATGSLWVEMEYAQVYCSVACVVTISRDGTAATTTAATPNSLNGGVTATAKAFIDSDAGSGTTVLAVNVAAGETIGVNLDGMLLEDNNSTANNLTIQTGAISGDASIYIRWRETGR